MRGVVKNSLSSEVEIDCEDSLAEFAGRLGALPLSGLTIGLTGPLGAGKTTLVRFIVRSLAPCVKVSSPTYTLLHEYTLPGGGTVEHWDLYRLTGIPEDLLEPQEATVCRIIEWADKFRELDAEIDLNIAISFKKMDSQIEARLLRIACRDEAVEQQLFGLLFPSP